jgi:hypothetical protein
VRLSAATERAIDAALTDRFQSRPITVLVTDRPLSVRAAQGLARHVVSTHPGQQLEDAVGTLQDRRWVGAPETAVHDAVKSGHAPVALVAEPYPSGIMEMLKYEAFAGHRSVAIMDAQTAAYIRNTDMSILPRSTFIHVDGDRAGEVFLP